MNGCSRRPTPGREEREGLRGTTIYVLSGETAAAAVQARQLVKERDAGRSPQPVMTSAVASELTVAECLVKPMELDRQDLVRTYLGVLQSRQAPDVFPLGRAVLLEAARLRSIAGVPLPDADHAAKALRRRCDTVLTKRSWLPNHSRLPAVALGRPGLTLAVCIPLSH
jgi:hypothetical protein